VSLLGRGGMGEVYRATDMKLGRSSRFFGHSARRRGRSAPWRFRPVTHRMAGATSSIARDWTGWISSSDRSRSRRIR